MQKRNLIIVLGLSLINFVSAASFSLENVFDGIDPSTITLGAVFIISFALIYWALSRVIKDGTTGEPNKGIVGVTSITAALFATWGINTLNIDIENYLKLGLIFVASFVPINFILSRVIKNKTTGEPNKGIAGMISLALALIITYGVNTFDFDIENLFFDMGLPTDIFTIILPIITIIIIIAGIIFAIVKFKFVRKYFLFILGGLFFLLSFIVYEGNRLFMIILAVISGVIGLFLKFKKKDSVGGGNYNYKQTREEKRYRQQLEKEKYYQQKDVNKKLKRNWEQQQREKQMKAVGEFGKKWGGKIGKGAETVGKGVKWTANKSTRPIRKRIRAQKIANRREERLAKEQPGISKWQRANYRARYKELRKQYDKIGKQNPNDPRLPGLAQEAKRLIKLIR
ncbi:hypothetical protein KAJ87_01300 [Candidatus Pacearchaeota archaeon]|nr:hypothetical protein [Candidatus Pacearchaeota archaeon]